MIQPPKSWCLLCVFGLVAQAEVSSEQAIAGNQQLSNQDHAVENSHDGNIGSDQPPFKGDYTQIKYASDGLSLVTLDGFGSTQLKDLYAKLKEASQSQQNTLTFPGVPWDHDESHALTIKVFPENQYVSLTYQAEGFNYSLLTDPELRAQEISKDKANNGFSPHFDVTYQSIDQHMIGLGLPSQMLKSQYKSEIKWSWSSGPFTCQLSASALAWITPNYLFFHCDTEFVAKK